MGNYFVFHLHSMLSNPSTNIDSVTNFKSYVSEAKRLGMKGLCFSEHGNIFEFCHKKEEIEAAGMKYVHGMEAYLTDTLERGKRRAFHCILIARNYEGFLEINRLFTKSYNRNDGHFFYNPRITFDELEQTSDNIIVTSACLGGPLGKGEKEVQDRFLRFLVNNKNRSFLEIQHHNVAQQITYNQKLAQLSRDTGIKLIAGTDTHALNEEHMIGRKQLQISKGVNFPDEDEWDLVFKSYDELLSAYELQGSLPYDVYMEAIQNTNVLLDMCDSYALDTSKKYPKIYKDSVATFKQKINEGFEHNKYVKQHPKKEVIKRIREEEQVYEKVEAVDFMLLMCYLKEWQLKQGIYTGPGRGSVSGSEIAYVLGITEMDSIKFDLNFFRFLNPSRVTNSDIDLDFGDKDREKMKKFLLDDHMGLPNIQTAEIITFNTIKMKGAIKDIGRALRMPLKEVQDISNAVETDENQKQYINEKWRKKYPELFKYVDIVNGVITSIGTHPSGVLISDRDISSLIGLCSLSTTPYPVTALNMKELDALWFVKLDVLGLANVDLINQTCELAGIERLTPDNTDLDDMKVWESIRDDTTGIFQWASDQASAFIKKFMSDKVIKIAKEHNPNFSMLKHFSFGNGLLRPACASFRDSVANGEFYTNGLQELDDFLATTFGHCIEENQYVSTTEGQKKIKDVQIGDKVYTFDGVHTVINKFENGVKILVNVKLVNGVEVRCTPNHMFLTMEGWKMALSLTENDVVIFNGSPCHILSVIKCDYGNTYDLEVETAHNYIVNGVVVHNCSMQEDIMRFLVRFCGYSDGESDNVRRCVSGDTEITVVNGGRKKIKDLRVNDLVLSIDEKMFRFSCQKVNRVFDNGTQKVYGVLAYDGKKEYKIKTTKSHKFMTPSGYKMLSELNIGNHLVVMPNLSLARIEAITELGEEHVYDIEVDKNHNYIANGIWVHNCIAKKKGTEQLLPEIEQRFIEYSSQTYGITKEKCAEVIKPFLQVIQDASNYGFSWNHSDAYSCIGYICGYLRYYYPYEFIATALNVFQDKPEIFSTFVNYANRHGMKIAPPRFRKSQYTYIYNKEDQTIEKGLGSIKYINKDCADSLYAIRHMQFNSFTDFLYYVTENTSIDKRQLETLIKCNYFDEFGKNGKLIELLERFKEKYKKTHTDKTKMKRLEELREYEGYIDDYRLPFCEQIETELDVLGYIAFRAPCNKRLFYVVDSNTKYTPILNIYSLSSGKTSRCKVEKKAYAKSKIKNGDILYVQEATKKPDYIKTETGFQKKGTFSTVLTKYRTITDEELDRILGRN